MPGNVPSGCGNQWESSIPQQLTIAFDSDLLQHRSLKDCVATCVYRQRGGVTAVAGRLDLKPSHLSEVLGGGGDRNRKFDLDELEAYVREFKDLTPIHYLVAKFCGDTAAEQAAAQQRLVALLEQVQGLAAAAVTPLPKSRTR
jgi:hypothetical protein